MDRESHNDDGTAFNRQTLTVHEDHTSTVEFRTTAALLDQNCSATGTDVLAGTLVGFEPPLPDEDSEYVGTLTRTTRITTCGTRRNAAGIDAVCSINYVGDGFADVMFTLYQGQRGGYLQCIPNRPAWAALLPPRPAGPVNSVVTGTCDPAELAQLQSDYDKGQTAQHLDPTVLDRRP